jgi:two-component system, LuxR family, sensor kinase FixL
MAPTAIRQPNMTTGPCESAYFPSNTELEALLRLQDRLLNVSRLATVGEMSSGIAHELNQPLCAVANYAQACDRLLALPNPDIAEIRASLQAITSQALRAGDVIRRLRRVARTHEPHQEVTDINVLLAELTELIQSDAKHHQARYRLEAGSGLPRAWVDRLQIQQLVLNLVRNAIEALEQMPAEAREVTVRTSSNEAGEVQVQVCDLGPGVSAAIAPHLFAPFCTTKPAGTGLGLAMSLSIAKANAGTLAYRPNLPAGSCFVLTLPGAVARTRSEST